MLSKTRILRTQKNNVLCKCWSTVFRKLSAHSKFVPSCDNSHTFSIFFAGASRRKPVSASRYGYLLRLDEPFVLLTLVISNPPHSIQHPDQIQNHTEFLDRRCLVNSRPDLSDNHPDSSSQQWSLKRFSSVEHRFASFALNLVPINP